MKKKNPQKMLEKVYTPPPRKGGGGGGGWGKVPRLQPIPTEPTPILTFPLKGKGRLPLPFQGGGWEGDGLIHLPLKGRGH